jgi:DNA-binding Lrp family transcriptional regulator
MNGNGGELSSFLTKLSEDPQLQEAYTKDPEGTLRQAGVSEETIRTLLSRDLQAIKRVLEQALPGVHTTCFMVVIAPEP